MAKLCVYGSFEVREGFGPNDHGPLVFASERRYDADGEVELLAASGVDAQLFGVRPDGESVLLRTLVGRRAA